METQTNVLQQQWIVGTQPESAEYLLSIPVGQIVVTGNNDRQEFNPDDLALLAADIATNGLGQNPLVRPLANGNYELIAGERRTRAMRDILGWPEIVCKVRSVDDVTASNLMAAENINRVNLNPIEEAKAYKTRMDNFGYSAAKVAEILHVKLYRVTEGLALLTLADDIQQLVSVKQFPRKYALTLAESKLDTNRQRIALKAYNVAKYMNEHIWSDLLATLVDAQAAESQMSMFALEMQVVDMAKARTAEDTKGPKACTGVKADRTIPAVRRTDSDTLAAVFTRYINDLKASGHSEAAGAVGNLLNVAVTMKWVSMEGNIGNLEGIAGEELHETVVSDTEAQLPLNPPAPPTNEDIAYSEPMPAARQDIGVTTYTGLASKPHGYRGKTIPAIDYPDYNVDVLPGRWVRIYGLVLQSTLEDNTYVFSKRAFDKTYNIGSVTKRGIVTDITAKTVTVRKAGTCKRLDLFTFTWENCEQ